MRSYYGIPMDAPDRKPQGSSFEDGFTRTEDGCLEWQWATNGSDGDGYGKVQHEGKLWSVHTLAWTLCNGPVPKGMFVCHRCDNKLCGNVDHLFLDTPAGNSQDMVHKGRSARGERNSQAKLTESEVRAIRANSRTQRAIAADYGISDALVSNIKSRKTWGWLSD